MTIDFACPKCGASIHAPANAAGQTGTCLTCQARITVPDETVSEPSLAETPQQEQSNALPRKQSGVKAGGTKQAVLAQTQKNMGISPPPIPVAVRSARGSQGVPKAISDNGDASLE